MLRNIRPLALLAICALAAVAIPAVEPQTLAVNEARLQSRITELAKFGANPEGGVSRVAFSAADIAGREYISKLMREAGLVVRVDTAGEVERGQGDQRAEQQPVDARAGVVDVAGEHHADRERGHEQQADRGVGVDPARALHAFQHAGEADGADERGELCGNPPWARHDQPRERRGADRVRVERQPPQHDPRPEHAGEHGEQQDLDDPALDVGDGQVRAFRRQSTAPPLKPATSARVLDSIEEM